MFLAHPSGSWFKMEASNSPILQKLTEKTSFSDSSVTVHAVAVTFRQFPCRDLKRALAPNITSVGHCPRQPRNAGRWHRTYRSCVRRHLRFLLENHGYSASQPIRRECLRGFGGQNDMLCGWTDLRSPTGGNNSYFRLFWTNI
jgi:hypothetical protein